MSGYACSNCGETAVVFGQRDGARQAAEESDVDFLGAVPLMPVAIGGSRGTDHDGESEHSTRTPLAWEPSSNHAVGDSDNICVAETAVELRQLCVAIDAAVGNNNWPEVQALSNQLVRNARLAVSCAEPNSGHHAQAVQANARRQARDVYMGIAERIADKLGLVAPRSPQA
jgi:hypothetical protein